MVKTSIKKYLPEGYGIGIGIGNGMPLGLIIGLLMENMWLGIGIGLLIGFAYGIVFEDQYKNEKTRKKRLIWIPIILEIIFLLCLGILIWLKFFRVL